MTKPNEIMNVNDILKMIIGGEYFLNLPRNENFPKFERLRNKKTGEYLLRVLLVGYKKEDIKLSLQNNQLVIEHTKNNEENNEDYEYLSDKIIAQRSFKIGFSITPNLELSEAVFKEGILTITFKPIEATPRLIELK
jgi:HSP20 family molecular chaperone IbpA